MSEGNGKPPNVVDMAEARKRQKTLKRQGAAAGKPGEPGNKNSVVWAVVQVALFLVVLYVGMKSCHPNS